MMMLQLLAQATDPNAGGAPSGGPGPLIGQFLPLILIIAVFWFMMSRGRNKEKQRFEQMLASMKRGDRVQSIGGIYGTIVDVRDNEVVVKVDESANVKIRFARNAIKEVQKEPGVETR